MSANNTDPTPMTPPLTHELIAQVLSNWKLRRLWTSLLALVGFAVFVAGGVSFISQWQANDELLETGVYVPATLYENSSGRSADLHVEYMFDGNVYREEISGGIITSFRGSRGDDVTVIIDPDDPTFVRTPNHRNIRMVSRFALLSAPFVYLAYILSRGSWAVGRSLPDAPWYRGEFEVVKAGGGWSRASHYRAILWNDNGVPIASRNRMQGEFRSGRARSGCYFAVFDKYVLAVPDGDDQGVLVPLTQALVISDMPVLPQHTL